MKIFSGLFLCAKINVDVLCFCLCFIKVAVYFERFRSVRINISLVQLPSVSTCLYTTTKFNTSVNALLQWVFLRSIHFAAPLLVLTFRFDYSISTTSKFC